MSKQLALMQLGLILRSASLATILAALASPVQAQMQPLWDATPGTAPYLNQYSPFMHGANGRLLAWGSRGIITTDGTVAGTSIVREVPRPFSARGFRMMPRTTDVLAVCRNLLNTELWLTDGTNAGTHLVTRLPEPVAEDLSFPQPFFAVATTLGNLGIFTLFTANEGAELWRTDGTAAGTYLLRDIAPGPLGSEPRELCAMGNRVFFVANDGTSGDELWATDGTVAGTNQVRDIEPGSAGSSPFSLTAWGGDLYFSASDSLHGSELWRSDGTANGTTLVVDLQPGPASSYPNCLVDAGAFLGFCATTPATGNEPWRTDGTASGTSMIADLVPGAASSNAYDGFASGGLWYMTNGSELWASDGTAPGTALVISPVNTSHYAFADLGGITYFLDQGISGSDLYRTDGTAAGTHWITSTPATSLTVNGGLLITNSCLRSDGTANGTWSFYSEGQSTDWVTFKPLPHTRALVSTMLFGAALPPNLWSIDGATGARIMLQSTEFSSKDTAILADGKSIVFAGSQGIFRSDGTPGGTSQLLPINISSYGGLFVEVGRITCFFIDDPINGKYLWGTDGFNTSPLALIRLGPASSAVQPVQAPASLGSRAIFFADNGRYGGTQPWVTDGTTAGTFMLRGVNQLLNIAPDRCQLAVFGDRAFFAADDGVHGDELWVTDGTTNGTVLFADLSPGPTSSHPHPCGAFPGGLLFSAEHATAGVELWRSDGTPGGTSLLKDCNPGPADSHFAMFAPGTNLCFFTAFDDLFGNELWRTDGTPAGTFRVADTSPGPESGNGMALRVFADRDVALFEATEPTTGSELWLTDGTPQGTHLVQDLQPGPAGALNFYGGLDLESFFMQDAAVAGRTLLLNAYTETTGAELFSGDLHAILGGLAIALPIGRGCPGTHGVPTLRTTSPPVSGNAQFGVTLRTGLPNSPALFGGALAEQETALGHGCWYHLQAPAATVFVLCDANGDAHLTLPLPNAPAFLGMDLLLQAAVLDPQGVLPGIAVSPGLRAIVGSH